MRDFITDEEYWTLWDVVKLIGKILGVIVLVSGCIYIFAKCFGVV